MRWGSQLADMISPVVDFLYPPRCPLCGEAIAQQTGICASCWSGLELPGEPSCATCGRPLPNHTAGQNLQCGACLKQTPLHDGIIAATRYNEASRQLILRFKHGGKIALAELIGRMIAARMPDPERGQVLVPVPLHPIRLWQRGFNQSALIANELAKRGKGSLLVDALRRTRHTPSLGGLDRHARRSALKGTIKVQARDRRRIAGSAVVLIDDVLTSGATSDACVGALRRAGAQSIQIVCFARVFD